MSRDPLNDLTLFDDLIPPAFKNVALCTQVGEPEWWFDAPAVFEKMARETCYMCPAFSECREENDRIESQWAKAVHRPLYGIFAGENPRERRARRKAERDGKPAPKGYASECDACGRRVIDQNAVRVTKGKSKRRFYACAHCVNTTSPDKEVRP